MRAFFGRRAICLVWYASKELTRSASAVNDWASHRLGRTFCDRPSKDIEGRMAYSQLDRPTEVLCGSPRRDGKTCRASRPAQPNDAINSGVIRQHEEET
jgi:hypothetical protein